MSSQDPTQTLNHSQDQGLEVFSEPINLPSAPSTDMSDVTLSGIEQKLLSMGYLAAWLEALSCDNELSWTARRQRAQEMQSILSDWSADEVLSQSAIILPYVIGAPWQLAPMHKAFGLEVAQLLEQIIKVLPITRSVTPVMTNPKSPGAVESLSSKSEHKSALRSTQKVELLRKMVLVFAKDIRVVIVVLAERLAWFKYCAAAKLTPEAQLVEDTFHLFAPLANRLGLWQLKWQLEDYAFRFQSPETYKTIARHLDAKRVEREALIEQRVTQLKLQLEAEHIDAHVYGRSKHIYSIWRKMKGKSLLFSDLYDIRALRVIVQTVADCYHTLGIVHQLWQPVPREFDDYIAHPKPNGYQSLHTVVMDPSGLSFEIQIRTDSMHQYAEYGVAAHWRYKEAGRAGYSGQFAANSAYDQKMAWARQLLAWHRDAQNTSEIGDRSPRAPVWEVLAHLDWDDHIYVFTPKADIVSLPKNATPLDFAYHIHTSIGHRCKGARVDGQMVSLNTPLHNGQVVEIVAGKHESPSLDWLNPHLQYVVSPRSRHKIRAWFKAQDQDALLQSGRAILEKLLHRNGRAKVAVELLSHQLGFAKANELMLALARGEIMSASVEQAIKILQNKKNDKRDIVSHNSGRKRPLIVPKRISSPSATVLVGGESDIHTTMAQCCKPLPGDAIYGYISQQQSIKIHRHNCQVLQRLRSDRPDRLLPVAWANQEGGRFAADLVVHLKTEFTQTFLKWMADALSKHQVVLSQMQQTAKNHAESQVLLTVQLPNREVLDSFLHQLAECDGVLDVVRSLG